MLFLMHVRNNAQTTIQINDFVSDHLPGNSLYFLSCATLLLLPLPEFTMPLRKEATVLAVTVSSIYKL